MKLSPMAVPKMPPGLIELMEGLTKDVLKNNPPDVYVFCANHIKTLLELRDGTSRYKALGVEQKIKLAQNIVKQRAEQRWLKYQKECVVNDEPDSSNLLDEEKCAVEKSTDVLNDNIVLNPIQKECDLTNASEIEISCGPTSTNIVADNIKKVIESSAFAAVYTDVESDVTNDSTIPIENESRGTVEVNDTHEASMIDEKIEESFPTQAKNMFPIEESESPKKSANKQIDSNVVNFQKEIEIDVPDKSMNDSDKVLHASGIGQDLVDVAKDDEDQNENDINKLNIEDPVVSRDDIEVRVYSPEVDGETDKVDSIESNVSETSTKVTDNIKTDKITIVQQADNNGQITDNQNTVIISKEEITIDDGINNKSSCETSDLNDLDRDQTNENAPNKTTQEANIEKVDASYQSDEKTEVSLRIDNSNELDNDVEIIESPVNLIETSDDRYQMPYKDNTIIIANYVQVDDIALKPLDLESVSHVESLVSDHHEFLEETTNMSNALHSIENSNITTVADDSNGNNKNEDEINSLTFHNFESKGSNKMFVESEDISETINGNVNNETTDTTVQEKEELFKNIDLVLENKQDIVVASADKLDSSVDQSTEETISTIEGVVTDHSDDTGLNDSANTMDLETAAVTIQKVFRTFLFKSRASTFDDSTNDDENLLYDDNEEDNKDSQIYLPSTLNKDRRTLGISRMDTVLQTVNEEKSLSLSTDDSSTLSSAATIIQAQVRGLLVRNKLNSAKTASSNNSLINSDGIKTSLEGDTGEIKNKTVLNIHIVPESNNFLSRDESMFTSMDLSLDGSPPSSLNLHPLGFAKTNERRKQLKREDAIQSISPPSNNSGKLSDDVNENVNISVDNDTATAILMKDTSQDTEVGSIDTTPTNSVTVETVVEDYASNTEIFSSPEPINKKRTLSKQSSDEMDVITPKTNYRSQDDEVSTKLLHSGEFHEMVIPTKVSRSNTPVVSGE